MTVDRILQLHAVGLVILGAVFVSQRPEAPLVPGLAVLLAISAFTLTDVLGWIKLKRWLSNLVVIAAVLWSLREFFDIASEEKLIAIANMLCYMQMVLLFQEKGLRVYWQLFVLSILQVVVAAALDLGPQFAILLGAYAVVALSTLLLLCMFRELEPASAAALPSRQRKNTSPFLAPPEIVPGRLTAEQLRHGLRWRTLIRQVALFSLVTFIFAIAFFYATPRMSENSWLAGKPRGGTLNFQPEVRLEERGRIHLSGQVVMRAALTRMSDRQPIQLAGDPYFHGEVLTEYRYDERGARWLPRRSQFFNEGGRRGRFSTTVPQSTVSMTRQEIVLEASTNNRRFAIAPNQPISDYPAAGYGWPRSAEIEPYAVPRHRRYSYATPAIASNRQVHASPNPNRLLTTGDGAAFGEEEEQSLAFDAARFPGIAAVAKEVVESHQLENARLLDRALALEQHFHYPGRFTYSLNLDFERNSQLDPIEDFVINHRKGHCEYFASALVLMLRSQGIPARMVLGYKGGSFNTVGQYYVVQQRHAHAWVEAWVPTDDLPPGELAGPPSDGGAWYRLDPTPDREMILTANNETLAGRMAQAFDYVELMWRDYVLSLNRNRQEDIVYEPLNAKVGMVPSWVESRRLRGWLRQLSRSIGLDDGGPPNRHKRTPFEPGVAIFVVAVLLALVSLVFGLRFAADAVRRWLGVQKHLVSSKAPPFYRRLERVLLRLPAIRSAAQTPQELAKIALERLVRRGLKREADVPDTVVRAYYNVRFGNGHLDKTEIEAIEQSLNALSTAIAKRSPSTSA